jgi:hypothetical protein
MWLDKHGELKLSDGTQLRSDYMEVKEGTGRVNLELVAPSYDVIGKTVLDLEPWAPEGFLVYEWLPGKACVVCGATCILLVETRTLAVLGAIPLESEEFRVRSTPWFAADEELLVIASEWRVFCVDRRIAIRWPWSTRVYSMDSWMISEPPVLSNSTVTVRLARLDQRRELLLRASDAAVL